MVDQTAQGTMGTHLWHQHSSIFLSLQVLPGAYETRRHHHQLLLREPLHWPSRSSGLHLDQGRHCRLYPGSLEPAVEKGYSRQLRLPRT